MKKYPMLMTPVSKQIIWGGDRLKKEYGKVADFDKIAESWELSVRSGAMCSIKNGEYAGMAMDEYISADRNGVLGKNCEKYDRFPLLIKFIDAADRLSIQEHPDNEYSLAHEGELGKTEMWYVIKADTGAKIYSGLKKSITPEQYEELVRPDAKGNPLEDVIACHESHDGDLYFLPAGRLHAIGAGNFLAEIQQTSDVTYRVYDFGRKDANGRPRELHVKEAKDAIDYRIWPEYRTSYDSTKPTSELISCPYFKVSRVVVQVASQVDFKCDSFVVVMCLWGEAVVNGVSGRKGETLLVPASENVLNIVGSVSQVTELTRLIIEGVFGTKYTDSFEIKIETECPKQITCRGGIKLQNSSDSDKTPLFSTSTIKAINEIQLFLEYYPYSRHKRDVQDMLFELQDRLVEKESRAAQLSFNLGNYMGNNYQACVITAQNALKDYPYTTLREDFALLIMKSKF